MKFNLILTSTVLRKKIIQIMPIKKSSTTKSDSKRVR